MVLERYTPQQDQASLSPSFTLLGPNGKSPAQKGKKSTSNKYVRFCKASHFLSTIAVEPVLTAWSFLTGGRNLPRARKLPQKLPQTAGPRRHQLPDTLRVGDL